MLYPSLPELLKQVDGRYLLVNVIAQRAREISQNTDSMGEPLEKKPVSTAIEEIAAGDIRVSLKL